MAEPDIEELKTKRLALLQEHEQISKDIKSIKSELHQTKVVSADGYDWTHWKKLNAALGYRQSRAQHIQRELSTLKEKIKSLNLEAVQEKQRLEAFVQAVIELFDPSDLADVMAAVDARFPATSKTDKLLYLLSRWAVV